MTDWRSEPDTSERTSRRPRHRRVRVRRCPNCGRAITGDLTKCPRCRIYLGKSLSWRSWIVIGLIAIAVLLLTRK